MCTAAVFQARDLYFGRTLDYDFSYGDQVVVSPRGYRFPFRQVTGPEKGYALIGAACVLDGVPLYYDAVNEKGLCMAGLNFVGNAVYGKGLPEKDNVAQFEFIPWILTQCATVREARELLARVNLTDDSFRRDLPVASLHWILADRTETIVVEAVADGLHIYPNPAGVMTNNPPFPEQMAFLARFQNLTAEEPVNRFAPELPLERVSRGMGAIGLPGDLSSQSRFVRAAFARGNALPRDGEEENVSQFFHILGTVEQPLGCCRLGGGRYEKTIYTACCNASRGIYYYKTYDNHQITAVDMHREQLDGREPVRYPMVQEERIFLQNS